MKKTEIVVDCPLCATYWEARQQFNRMCDILAEAVNSNDLTEELYNQCVEALKEFNRAGRAMLREHPRCAGCTILLGKGHDTSYVNVGGKLFCLNCFREAVLVEEE